MKEETGPFWVDCSLESEEMEERVWEAVDQARYVRDWAVHELNERWRASSGYPTTAELVPAMTQFVRSKGYGLQRYTSLAILNSTVTTFNQMVREEKVEGVAIVNLPKIDMSEPVELTFQARSVWGKYVYEYARLSSIWGSIFLECEWERVLAEQAQAMGVSRKLFPYLWYSASLKTTAGLYQVRFNAHRPNSQAGKKLAKKRREQQKWQVSG